MTKSSSLVLLLPFKVPRLPYTKTCQPCQFLLKRLVRRGLLELLALLSPFWPRRTTGERDLDGFESLEYPLRLHPRRERWRWCGAKLSEYKSDDTDLSLLSRPLARHEERWSVLRWYSSLRLPGAVHGRLAFVSVVCFHFKNDDTVPISLIINKFIETTSALEMRERYNNIII